ncbi:MAG: hypothetical protein K1060chlam1_00013 [Candidatus Anoxychlamydiales bacterium]|nr:hypothetical protein [Candidatus Anoxychlamydiales bacterium]
MTVNPVFVNALNSSSFDRQNQAMLTEWNVTLSKGYQKTYYMLVLQKPIEKTFFSFRSASSGTSVYITDVVPKREDLSASEAHTKDSLKKTFKDSTGRVICAYDEKCSTNLGFDIEEAEFKRVDEISQGLIDRLGAFLKTHLDRDSSSASASRAVAAEVSSSSSASGPASLPASSSTSKPQGWLSSLGSRAASLVTCNRVAVIMAFAPAIITWAYLNSDNPDLSEITSAL